MSKNNGRERRLGSIEDISSKVDSKTEQEVMNAINASGIIGANIVLTRSVGNNQIDESELLNHLSDFDVILNDSIMRTGFRKFLQSKNSIKYFNFWKEVENFKSLSSDSEELRE